MTLANADDAFRERLLATYRRHHLRLETLRHRIAGLGRDRSPTVSDLAIDDGSGVTDQNHPGGVQTVDHLARAAGITADDVVCDIGGGLGGSARWLAHRFGCRVHVVDISPDRCAAAEELTRQVGLSRLVTVECGDVVAMPVPLATYSVLWGQSAWVHIADKSFFLARWRHALLAHGRVAMDDAYWRTAPAAHDAATRELSELWLATIPSQHEWRSIFHGAGFTIRHFEDLTAVLAKDLDKWASLANAGGLPPQEQRAFDLARGLIGEGVLGYCAVIAV